MIQFVTDLFSNFWVSLTGKLLLVALMIPLIGMVIGYAEMKLSAKMQSRVSPYFAGGRWGWAQLIADGVKFFQKEDLVPDEADRPVFKIAPVLVLVSTVAVLVIIPFGPAPFILPSSIVGTPRMLRTSIRLRARHRRAP